MKKNNIQEVYCIGSIPVDTGQISLYDLGVKKIKKSLNERELVRKLCLSIGLLQPGDSRDVIVDILYVLLKAKKQSKDVIFYLIGIHPDYQNKGVTAVLFDSLLKTLKNKGIKLTIVDARFAKPLDQELILKCAREHEVMITVEEGSIGGFGSHVENLLSEKGIFDKGLKFRTMILPDIFIEQDSPKKMYDVAGLNASQISKKILGILFTKESIKVVKN